MREDNELDPRGNPPRLPAAMPFDRISPRLAQRWRRFGDEGEAMLVVWLGGEEMLAVAGEGGEAVWAVVGEVVRMAWFVEMRRGYGGGGWRCGWWLVQNNDSKRKMATSKITARLHE